MDNIGLFIIFGAATVYFGLKALQILPTIFSLLVALATGMVKWPGPRIHDPDPSASKVRERLGTGYQNLFSTFLFNAMGVIAAFIFSLLTFISNTSYMSRYIWIDWSWVTILLTFFAFIGGQMGVKKTQQYLVQINAIFSDLIKEVEPREVDGQSARSQYAIEHPLLGKRNLPSDTKRALDQFYESVRYHQDGNELRALNLYNEATRLDPSLHKNAREALLNMTEGSGSAEEGAINYWLGIHSEWLSDWRNAATYYENSVNAFSQIGYDRRASRACNNLGNVKMQMGDPYIMDEFDRAISLDPQNGMAYMSIGIIYYRISERGDPRFETAMNAFADAIAANPAAYTPLVLSRLRSIGYTWKEDWEDISRRVVSRQTGNHVDDNVSTKKPGELKKGGLGFATNPQLGKSGESGSRKQKELGFKTNEPAEELTKTYRNKIHGFEIDIPVEWQPAPIPKQGNKDLFQYGCYDEAFNFEIGPLFPEPPLEQTEYAFVQFVSLMGYSALKLCRITISGKEHVCASYYINNAMGERWNKKYMIVYHGTEYAITATCNEKDWFVKREKDWDEIVKSFRLLEVNS